MNRCLPWLFAALSLVLVSCRAAPQQSFEPAIITAVDQHSFVVIGDFGSDSENEAAVAALIKTKLKPEFIVTVGDNNYGRHTPEGYDLAIGKYFHTFIGAYAGKFGDGALANRFFPALGNHDWSMNTGYDAYIDFFTLPGNERYYDFTKEDAHFFIINSDTHEPDGRTSDSRQANWLRSAMAGSKEKWKFVFMHHPPFSSSTHHGSEEAMRWPFATWGATAVFAGHDHTYERLDIDGTPYFVTGLGGKSKYELGDRLPQTRFRNNQSYGAMLVTYDEHQVKFEFWSVHDGGTLLDTHIISVAKPNAE